MTMVWHLATVMLFAASILIMYRMLAGPNTLDRLVAVDTLVSVTMCALAVWAAYSRDSTVLYSIVALSLISFLSSVSITRFRVPDTAIDPRDDRRRR